jgi:hypothetical protein
MINTAISILVGFLPEQALHQRLRDRFYSVSASSAHDHPWSCMTYVSDLLIVASSHIGLAA